MRYLSVCSGIEAATQAFHPHGWEPVAFSEIEPFPCAVLKHHYPDVPNWGDMTKFKDWPDAAVDVLCGGTPCQSFSVAGLRQGLADPRGNLMLTFGAIAARYRPKWLVWENVPGVLSSNGGRDFAAFLSLLGQLWYGWAYRVLDAQHVRTRRFPHAVPQRRRRVFVVGYLGDWRRAAAVLFDRESLSGHPAPRRETGQGIARGIEFGPSGGGFAEVNPTLDTRAKDGPIRNQLAWAALCAPVAPTLNAHFGDKQGLENQHINGGGDCSLPAVSMCLNAGAMGMIDAESETFIPTIGGGFDVAGTLLGNGFDGSPDGTGRGMQIVPIAIQERAVSENPDAGPQGSGIRQDGAAYTLEARNKVQAVAFGAQNSHHQGDSVSEGFSPTLDKSKTPAVAFEMEIRNADAYEADASSALSTLRKAVGEEAYAEWGLAILAAFQSSEVLQLWLHGGSLQSATEEVRSRLDDGALSRPQHSAGWVLFNLWVHGPDGRSPQGRGLAKQLAGKPGEALSVLPHEGTSQEGDMLRLRWASEGAGILREALSAVQEVGKSVGTENQSASPPWAVRRLTPREAERLQGFPDDFTRIPYRGKHADLCPDGPRYKALGNSWAVNCADWLAERITIAAQWGQP